jgi:hypothetical protein
MTMLAFPFQCPLPKIFRDFAFRRTLRGYLFPTVEESRRARVAGTVKNASRAATEHCHGAWQSLAVAGSRWQSD